MDSKPNYSNGNNPDIQIPRGHKKVTLVGDVGCGKTSLVLAYMEARKRDIEEASQPPRPEEQPPPGMSSETGQPQPSTSSEQPQSSQELPQSSEESAHSPEDTSSSSGSDEDSLPQHPTPFFHAREYLTSVEIRRPTEVATAVVPIKICDVPGDPEHKSLRPPTYQRSGVVLICFAIDDPRSFANVEQRWIHEIRYFLMNIPLVLVGMKKDLRTDEETIRRLSELNTAPVSYQQALDLKQKYYFARYVECSTKNGDAVKEVFQTSILGMEEKEENSMEIV